LSHIFSSDWIRAVLPVEASMLDWVTYEWRTTGSNTFEASMKMPAIFDAIDQIVTGFYG